MKLSLAVLLLKGSSALTCWSCEEKSYADCIDATKNAHVACPKADITDDGTVVSGKTWVCSLEVHQRFGKKIDYVNAGCRQSEACTNDAGQNNVAGTTLNDSNDGGYQLSKQQCWINDKRRNSKCRVCCNNADDCNLTMATTPGGISWP